HPHRPAAGVRPLSAVAARPRSRSLRRRAAGARRGQGPRRGRGGSRARRRGLRAARGRRRPARGAGRPRPHPRGDRHEPGVELSRVARRSRGRIRVCRVHAARNVQVSAPQRRAARDPRPGGDVGRDVRDAERARRHQGDLLQPPGPYRIPHFACEVQAVLTNKTPTGTYRGPGRFEANFFRERLLDLMASDLGLDPAEVRLKNLITPAELPWPIGTLVPYEASGEYDGGDYGAALRRALEASDYARLAKD